MDIEKLIEEYKDKGGNEERLVREILQSKRKDIVEFIERMIHKYSNLRKFPFKVLVDLKFPDASIDFEKMEKYIDGTINYKPLVVFQKAKPKPKPEPKKAKPPKEVDYEQFVHELIALFREPGDSRTDGQILTEKSGPHDISLMELFEYVYSDYRESIDSAIPIGMGYFMEKSGINMKSAREKVLAQLEIITRSKNEEYRKILLDYCRVPEKEKYVSIHGYDFGNGKDTEFLTKLKSLFLSSSLQISNPKEREGILKALRQKAEHVLTQTATMQPQPQPVVHDEKVSNFMEQLLVYFRGEGNTPTDGQLLTETFGPNDISLIELFEYLLSEDRTLVASAIQSRDRETIKKLNMDEKNNKYKSLVHLDVIIPLEGFGVRHGSELIKELLESRKGEWNWDWDWDDEFVPTKDLIYAVSMGYLWAVEDYYNDKGGYVVKPRYLSIHGCDFVNEDQLEGQVMLKKLFRKTSPLDLEHFPENEYSMEKSERLKDFERLINENSQLLLEPTTRKQMLDLLRERAGKQVKFKVETSREGIAAVVRHALRTGVSQETCEQVRNHKDERTPYRGEK